MFIAGYLALHRSVYGLIINPISLYIDIINHIDDPNPGRLTESAFLLINLQGTSLEAAKNTTRKIQKEDGTKNNRPPQVCRTGKRFRPVPMCL
jgi:hypothetical protein